MTYLVGDGGDVALHLLVAGELQRLLHHVLDDLDVRLAEGGHQRCVLAIALAVHVRLGVDQ